jgi:hypothetical protein
MSLTDQNRWRLRLQLHNFHAGDAYRDAPLKNPRAHPVLQGGDHLDCFTWDLAPLKPPTRADKARFPLSSGPIHGSSPCSDVSTTCRAMITKLTSSIGPGRSLGRIHRCRMDLMTPTSLLETFTASAAATTLPMCKLASQGPMRPPKASSSTFTSGLRVCCFRSTGLSEPSHIWRD